MHATFNSEKRTALRRADSNTLLRLYDRASGELGRAEFQQDRERAARAARLIADELRRRGVRP
jgi:hypothetical protein